MGKLTKEEQKIYEELKEKYKNDKGALKQIEQETKEKKRDWEQLRWVLEMF